MLTHEEESHTGTLQVGTESTSGMLVPQPEIVSADNTPSGAVAVSWSDSTAGSVYWIRQFPIRFGSWDLSAPHIFVSVVRVKHRVFPIRPVLRLYGVYGSLRRCGRHGH